MDDMLRQLLSMINAVPPPGRAQGSAVDPKVQQAQMQAEVTDLGRVGGMHQKDAQLPTGPMMDNGLGGQVPVPMTDLGRIGGDPAHAARMPNRPMVDNGRGSMVPAQNTQVSGVSMPPQYDTQMAGVSMPPQMNTQVTGVDMPQQYNTQVAGVDMPQQQGHQGPVHLHLNEDVLKALIKHKSKATAEDGAGE